MNQLPSIVQKFIRTMWPKATWFDYFVPFGIERKWLTQKRTIEVHCSGEKYLYEFIMENYGHMVKTMQPVNSKHYFIDNYSFQNALGAAERDQKDVKRKHRSLEPLVR